MNNRDNLATGKMYRSIVTLSLIALTGPLGPAAAQSACEEDRSQGTLTIPTIGQDSLPLAVNAPIVIPGPFLATPSGNGYTVGSPIAASAPYPAGGFTTGLGYPGIYSAYNSAFAFNHGVSPYFWGHGMRSFGPGYISLPGYHHSWGSGLGSGLGYGRNYWQFANYGLGFAANHADNHSLYGPMSGYGFVQTAPSKASGNYYAPSTADSSASGSYYAEKPAAYQYMRPAGQYGAAKTDSSNYYKPQKNYWGSSSPYPADLNSTPWSK